MALRQEEFTSLCDDVDLDRDRALVERCQAGDSGAFGNLYARYYERLLRFCLRRLNDRHEAEDAAQEAFARAWKALPQFAGERRFYPWLTVIAGNICTDMLRRRSRSTPTDDLELGAHQPVGGGANETSEELILAAVDGELVNKALDRLSDRHRHVLAMREGSGWTYQQIADHEGVEIGTIETLLWRARQALKREFTVLSESKGALAGFLIGAGALLRKGFLRASHRAAELQGTGGSGAFRNAMAGMAFTSAAVAAALITPHALSGSGSASGATPAPTLAALSSTGSGLAPGAAGLSRALSAQSSASPGSSPTAPGTTGTGAAGTSGTGSSTSGGGGVASSITGSGQDPLGLQLGDTQNGSGSQGLTQVVGGAQSTVSNVQSTVGSTVGGLSTTATSTIGSVVGSAVSGVTNLLTPPAATGSTSSPTTPVTLPPVVSNLTGGLGSTLNSLPGL